MKSDDYPIPGTLNLLLAALVAFLCSTFLIVAGRVDSWPCLLVLASAYGLVMNAGYALCHEAEHDMFHPNPLINNLGGALVSLFFPASFHLRRQGHIGHHLRNRTDDEAFDIYCIGESRLWKFLQFYGILTGLFWVAIVISNFVAVLHPALLTKVRPRFDRATCALQETLNPRYNWIIRLEAFVVILFHGLLIIFFHIPFLHYFVVMGGFGFLWSTLQYIHHYGTVRDIQEGACNLTSWKFFAILWMNHHLHLNHHRHPTVPWIHLPKVGDENHPPPTPFWKAYFSMWRGPKTAQSPCRNPHAGHLIR